MNNYLILIAGGVGSRMKSDIPKQFIKVNEKPIIIHTLEKFQLNDQIKKIVVVCLKDWMDYVKELIQELTENID